MSAKISVWTTERDLQLRMLARTHLTPQRKPDWAAISTFMGVSREAARLRFRALPVAIGGALPEEMVLAAQQRQETMQTLRTERDLIEAVAGEKSFRALLESLATRTTQLLPIIPPYRAPKEQKGATIETVFQELSDFHGGESVTRERTRGFNEFSTTILAQRLKRVIDSHVSIKQRMERGGGWKFKKLVVGLNGDLVSGTIHEIERHSDAKNVVMAVYAVAMILAQALRDLAAQYPEVEIYCTSGNHGRLPDARRVQQKDPTRSWDTMIALLAKEHLRASPHITFHIPDSYSVAYDIEGWTFLQTHGHDVKSWNSIPWYGLNRLVGNLNALEASRRSTIHYWVFAHFHSKSSLEHASGESFINGSMIGGTEYSLNSLGKSDKPCQWMLMVHKEHGVTSRWPLIGACPDDAPGYTVPAIALKE